MLNEKISSIKNEIRAFSNSVAIIAATKTVSPEVINLLPDAGIKIAGENRVQELLEKYDKVRGVEWHFIGALQTNKVKYIIDKVTLIQSLDRAALADEIDRQAKKIDKIMDVLVEVNMGREASKSGVYPENLEELLEYVSLKENLRLKGLMSVLPIDAPSFMYDELNEKFCFYKQKFLQMEILSVGMSGDYITAVKKGSNMIRLGSAIFGKRK